MKVEFNVVRQKPDGVTREAKKVGKQLEEFCPGIAQGVVVVLDVV